MVHPNDHVGRFVFEKKYVKNSKVSYGAFGPHTPKNSPPKKLETSVFLITRLKDSQIWDIRKGIERLRARPLLGRADVIAQNVYDVNLEIYLCDAPNTVPHFDRHANLVGWPSDENELIMRASELALKASFSVFKGA